MQLLHNYPNSLTLFTKLLLFNTVNSNIMFMGHSSIIQWENNSKSNFFFHVLPILKIIIILSLYLLLHIILHRSYWTCPFINQ